MKSLVKIIAWVAVALLGATALGTIAFHRGEPINATWFVLAAGCFYVVAYRCTRRSSRRNFWRWTIHERRRRNCATMDATLSPLINGFFSAIISQPLPARVR